MQSLLSSILYNATYPTLMYFFLVQKQTVYGDTIMV